MICLYLRHRLEAGIVDALLSREQIEILAEVTSPNKNFAAINFTRYMAISLFSL